MSNCCREDQGRNDRQKEIRNFVQYQFAPTHFFLELTSLDQLTSPISSSGHIKFICLDASPRFLVVGTNCGAVYIFSRYTSITQNCSNSLPIHAISTKEGPVTKVSISPNEKYLATASGNGSLRIWLFSSPGQSATVLLSNNFHVQKCLSNAPFRITNICWSSDSQKLFSGDVDGHVCCSRIQKRNLFRVSCEVLLETDSRIVQINISDNSLLVSTMTMCCLCDLDSLDCIQVGRKHRDGYFGALFHSIRRQSNKNLLGKYRYDVSGDLASLRVIFVCRPNGRLCEANGQGAVYRTHQYKENMVWFPIVSVNEENIDDGSEAIIETVPKNLTFGRLNLIHCDERDFLLTSDVSTFSLIDPFDGRLVLTCNKGNVSEYAVCGSDVFVLDQGCNKLRKISLFSVRKGVENLYQLKCFIQAAQVLHRVVVSSQCIGQDLWEVDMIDEIHRRVKDGEFSDKLAKLQKKDTVSSLGRLLAILELRKHIKDTVPSENHSFPTQSLKIGALGKLSTKGQGISAHGFRVRRPQFPWLRSKSTSNIGTTLSTNLVRSNSFPGINHPLTAEIRYDNQLSDGASNHKIHSTASRIRTNDNRLLSFDDSSESLKTLLGCKALHLNFDSQVTISDVTRDLACAKMFSKHIDDIMCGERKMKINFDASFASFFGRRDPLASFAKSGMPSENVSVQHYASHRLKKGARIVKAIKPHGKTMKLNEKQTNLSDLVYTEIDLELDLDNQTQDVLASVVAGFHEDDTEVVQAYSAHSVITADHITDLLSTELSNSSSAENLCDTNASNGYGRVIQCGLFTEMDWDSCDDKRSKFNDSVETLNTEVDEEGENLDTSRQTVTHSLQPGEMLSCVDGKSDENHCSNCGLHRSWRIILLFGSAMVQLRVISDEFKSGGVPFTLEQWCKLLQYYAEIAHRSELTMSKNQLCSDCLSCFDFGGRIDRLLESANMLFEKMLGIAPERRYYSSTTREQALSWNDEDTQKSFFDNARDLRFCKYSQLSIKRKDQFTEWKHKLISIVANATSPDFLAERFPWLSTITLSKLLLCLYLCEGIDALIDFLRENESVTILLTAHDWNWLVAIKIFEKERHRYVIPSKLVDDLIEEFKIDCVRDACRSKLHDSNTSQSTARFGLTNVVIAIDGNCGCCTLPLKSSVSDSDDNIVAFNCGHAYHRICMFVANMSICIQCEFKIHRQRPTQAVPSSTNQQQSYVNSRHKGMSSNDQQYIRRRIASTAPLLSRHTPLRGSHIKVALTVPSKGVNKKTYERS